MECEPAKFYNKRYIRYKYAVKDKSAVAIAELPESVIDKVIRENIKITFGRLTCLKLQVGSITYNTLWNSVVKLFMQNNFNA